MVALDRPHGGSRDLATCPGFITELIQRCGRGEQDALGRLLDLFYVPVLRAVRSRQPERPEDEAVAEVFGRVWRHSATYRPGGQGAVAWVLSQVPAAETEAGWAIRPPQPVR